MEQQSDRAQPKIPGGIEVTFKHGEVTKIELTVRHLVDDWFETDYRFKMDGSTAVLRSVYPEGDGYHIRQNRAALEHAMAEVENLPVVEAVEGLE